MNKNFKIHTVVNRPVVTDLYGNTRFLSNSWCWNGTCEWHTSITLNQKPLCFCLHILKKERNIYILRYLDTKRWLNISYCANKTKILLRTQFKDYYKHRRHRLFVGFILYLDKYSKNVAFLGMISLFRDWYELVHSVNFINLLYNLCASITLITTVMSQQKLQERYLSL